MNSIAKSGTAIVLVFTLCLFMQNAKAKTAPMGIFIEPLISYKRSTTFINIPSPFANSSGKTDGFGIGAGLRFLPISLNIEYQKITYHQTGLERLGPFSSGITLSNIKLESNS